MVLPTSPKKKRMTDLASAHSAVAPSSLLLFTWAGVCCRRRSPPRMQSSKTRTLPNPHLTTANTEALLHQQSRRHHRGVDKTTQQTSIDLPTLHRCSDQALRPLQEHQLLLPRVPASRLALAQEPMQKLQGLLWASSFHQLTPRRGLRARGRQAAVHVGASGGAGSRGGRR